MDVTLYQSKKNLFILAFKGFFEKRVRAIHFDRNGYFLRVEFEGLLQKEELNCPVPDDIREELIVQKVIVLSFFDGQDLKATQLAPFLVHNMYSDEELMRMNTQEEQMRESA